jgi:Domain of unknown function (DUF1874)
MATYLINSPVLPNYGKYDFSPLTVEQANMRLNTGFISAIGHDTTAKLLTHVLAQAIRVNRIQINLQVNDIAIVFRLTQRLPEGKLLTEAELFAMPFELGLLTRLW